MILTKISRYLLALSTKSLKDISFMNLGIKTHHQVVATGTYHQVVTGPYH